MIQLRIPFLVISLLLTGCQVTPDDARNKPAAFQMHSNRSSQQLSECIYNAWSTTAVIAKDETSHIEKTEQVISVYTWEDSMFADIYSRGKGSEVKFYKTFEMGDTVQSDRLSLLKACL
ncbi:MULTISPECIES: hypothetical protein [unclassified Pantoea]|jgi:micrococcal nuclease|uniref:hypothetical protein n=1 Tax=unclassified Pantoea TaxID=2630326 RepID=UPI001FA9E29A|nr:hypothetical protein [Pantoea sp. MQR6]